MKIARYAFVGGIAATIDLLVFIVFAKWLKFNYLLVGGVGFILATWVNYVLSIRHVFQSGVRFSKRGEIVGVYLVSAVGLVLHELVLYLLVSLVHIELVVSKIMAIGAVFFWNYFARHHYVFAERDPYVGCSQSERR